MRDPYAAIKKLIASNGSRIFSVHFVKADGTLRVMKVQQATAKFHVTPKEELEPERAQAIETRKVNNPHLLNVWDVEKNDFRSVNLNTLLEIHMAGVVYRVDGLKLVRADTGD